MKTKYLRIYYKWVKSGRLPGGSGLCKAFREERLSYNLLFLEFSSSKKEDAQFTDEMWFYDNMGLFTPLRQNVILLLAAMNNEL